MTPEQHPFAEEGREMWLKAPKNLFNRSLILKHLLLILLPKTKKTLRGPWSFPAYCRQ